MSVSNVKEKKNAKICSTALKSLLDRPQFLRERASTLHVGFKEISILFQRLKIVHRLQFLRVSILQILRQSLGQFRAEISHETAYFKTQV